MSNKITSNQELDDRKEKYLAELKKWNDENLPTILLDKLKNGEIKQWGMNARIFTIQKYKEACLILRKEDGRWYHRSTGALSTEEFEGFIKIFIELTKATDESTKE